MKTLLGLLCMAGFLLAAEQPASSPHVSYFTRVALRTQSPSVPTSGRNHRNRHPNYRVTETKSTIVAYIPYGK